MSDFLAERTEHWARALTAVPSVTGTKDEADFAAKLAELLKQSPAFSDASDIWLEAVPDGAFPRASVLALLRGEGARTIVLTGHFDIVETSCYGELEPLALDPDRLGPALIERISAEPREPRSARALEDLTSGDFLAGRGLLDMKAGLAAGIAAIEAFAKKPRAGNILFVAVPDEEGNSAGARHVAGRLGDIARARGLDFVAAINLDATVDDGDGSQGRVVSLGTIGKLLPSALVVGRPQHASDSFRGFGAAALAGALAAELEWAPELTERSGAELGAGPTLLGMKDNKSAYDVTMPASVWMYWNVATHRRAPDEVLIAVEAAAGRSSVALLDRLRQRAAAIGIAVGADEIAVIRYEALAAEVAAAHPDAGAIAAALAGELAARGASLPEQCRAATERMWALSGRSGPAIVIGFASVPYLPAELRDDADARRLEAIVRAAAKNISARFDTTIGTIRYFPGISDVSFFGQIGDSQVATIAANTPAWSTVTAGAQRFGAAGIPCINVGPWGRDYHTRLERMHVGYGFRVVPALVEAIVEGVLSD